MFEMVDAEKVAQKISTTLAIAFIKLNEKEKKKEKYASRIYYEILSNVFRILYQNVHV